MLRKPSKNKALCVRGDLEHRVFVEGRLFFKKTPNPMVAAKETGLIDGIGDGNKTDQSYV